MHFGFSRLGAGQTRTTFSRFLKLSRDPSSQRRPLATTLLGQDGISFRSAFKSAPPQTGGLVKRNAVDHVASRGSVYPTYVPSDRPFHNIGFERNYHAGHDADVPPPAYSATNGLPRPSRHQKLVTEYDHPNLAKYSPNLVSGHFSNFDPGAFMSGHSSTKSLSKPRNAGNLGLSATYSPFEDPFRLFSPEHDVLGSHGAEPPKDTLHRASDAGDYTPNYYSSATSEKLRQLGQYA
jgi:hypothetical protein